MNLNLGARITYHCIFSSSWILHATQCQRRCNCSKITHLKCTFIKAQLFLPSYCSFIVLGTSPVSTQLGGFLYHFIKEDGWWVSPFWNQHQLDFMSYLQCIKTVCVQHLTRRTQRFCCLFIFLMWQREKRIIKTIIGGKGNMRNRAALKFQVWTK